MRTQSTPQENSAAGLTPPIRPKMPWRVVEAYALTDFKLKVIFQDGLNGVVDMTRLIHSAEAGVFAPLADSKLFAQVFVEHGTVTWPGELDLAPDAMHRAIQSRVIWVI